MRIEKLGSVWVDTAQIIIGDPCQILKTEDNQVPTFEELHNKIFYTADVVDDLIDEARSVNSSSEATELIRRLQKIMPKFRRFVTFANNNGFTGAIAVLCGTDGWYPVYLEYNDQGNPHRIIIEIGKTSE
jgi:2-hydroxy-3-keto-5-methylthiopentenyl-1-phosphate phosphatase